MIELVAKAISNSLDLKLETVVNLYESQRLDDDELDIEIEVNERAGSVKIFEYLKKTFNLDGLERIDRFVCLFLALLPAEETLLSELIEWGGKAYEQSNKKIFVNACNRLHALGLIYREGDQVRMNRLLQEAIIYQERSMGAPFMTMMFQFVFLNARLQEGIAGNPQTALRFLKYAESILNNIKESFREKLRQPLLAIENEVLMIWTWFKPEIEMKDQWQDLATRSELYLKAEDPLLSIIASNCGMAYHKIDELDMAQHYYEKAITGMQPIEAKVLPLLLTCLGNLSLLFINKGDFQNFRPIFNEAVALRTRYKLWHDKTVPVHAYILAMANLKAENLIPAIELFHIAIDSHKDLPVKERDNTFLAGYLANLSMAYFFSGNVEKANTSINETAKILSQITVGDEKRWMQSGNRLTLSIRTIDLKFSISMLFFSTKVKKTTLFKSIDLVEKKSKETNS
ncbi:MAG: tetratricopeptide repeat protein [Sphingobacteriaceae bacterium]|nr:MAG: tetratricopeptide repeat protein [Sphingobacteriaceae bacterium]